MFLKLLQNSQENTCASASFFIKLRLWHKCFPMNFVKFLTAPFLQNTSWRLLLSFVEDVFTQNVFYEAQKQSLEKLWKVVALKSSGKSKGKRSGSNLGITKLRNDSVKFSWSKHKYWRFPGKDANVCVID